MDSKILKSFFEEQHHKWRKRTHTLYQTVCGNLSHHSGYSEWLKHHEGSDPAPHEEPRKVRSHRE